MTVMTKELKSKVIHLSPKNALKLVYTIRYVSLLQSNLVFYNLAMEGTTGTEYSVKVHCLWNLWKCEST